MACYENSSSVLILQMSPEFYKLEVQRLCYNLYQGPTHIPGYTFYGVGNRVHLKYRKNSACHNEIYFPLLLGSWMTNDVFCYMLRVVLYIM